MDELDFLTTHVFKEFGDIEIPDHKQMSAALSVLDCVLSLGRRYKSFVEPRIAAFATKNPDFTGLIDLLNMIKSYSSPKEFGMEKLDYNHDERMRTIVGVTRYLIVEQTNYAGDTEIKRLQAWANSSVPTDCAFVGVRGFDLAGFQYLRMLFGAQTSKPDVHIVNFVSETIGRRVEPEVALSMLKIAAERTNLPLLALDGAIWESRASK